MNEPQRGTLAPYESDPQTLRTVFSYFPSGVVALLARVDGEQHGMVASAFTVGVSTDPPLVSCAIQKRSSTWPVLRRAPHIGISVLAESQGDLARQIGNRDKAARFVDAPLREIGSSALFIEGAPVWFECTLWAEHDAGDHTIALFEVKALGADPTSSPLIFHGKGFRQLKQTEAELTGA
jgi:flavin reductase (DIM6/NTAB) family NADH-FMN oxidoreductase RutF